MKIIFALHRTAFLRRPMVTYGREDQGGGLSIVHLFYSLDWFGVNIVGRFERGAIEFKRGLNKLKRG